jgi:hypothetical protein
MLFSTSSRGAYFTKQIYRLPYTLCSGAHVSLLHNLASGSQLSYLPQNRGLEALL